MSSMEYYNQALQGKRKERICTTAREKKQRTDRGVPIHPAADIARETRQAREGGETCAAAKEM